jgi:hypothetical protein
VLVAVRCSNPTAADQLQRSATGSPAKLHCSTVRRVYSSNAARRRPAKLHCSPGGAPTQHRWSPAKLHCSPGGAPTQHRWSPAKLHCNSGGAPRRHRGLRRSSIATPAELQRSTDGVRRSSIASSSMLPSELREMPRRTVPTSRTTTLKVAVVLLQKSSSIKRAHRSLLTVSTGGVATQHRRWRRPELRKMLVTAMVLLQKTWIAAWSGSDEQEPYSRAGQRCPPPDLAATAL